MLNAKNSSEIRFNHRTFTRPSRDGFRFRRFRRTLRHICGKLVGFPGPNNRENRSTLSGRKSGKSSQTSVFAYFDGSIAANGVSNFRSFSLASSNAPGVLGPSDFPASSLMEKQKY